MENPNFNIVLFAPEIPQNTGNIGRICVCTECRLHLIRPISFQFDDAHLKRAGMDYWRQVDCSIHDSWEAFLAAEHPEHLRFYSTHATALYWDAPMERGSHLVFGSEGGGLPAFLHEQYRKDFYTIPMPGKFNRSLNLANSTGIVIYEGLRRFRSL